MTNHHTAHLPTTPAEVAADALARALQEAQAANARLKFNLDMLTEDLHFVAVRRNDLNLAVVEVEALRDHHARAWTECAEQLAEAQAENARLRVERDEIVDKAIIGSAQNARLTAERDADLALLNTYRREFDKLTDNFLRVVLQREAAEAWGKQYRVRALALVRQCALLRGTTEFVAAVGQVYSDNEVAAEAARDNLASTAADALGRALAEAQAENARLKFNNDLLAEDLRFVAGQRKDLEHEIEACQAIRDSHAAAWTECAAERDNLLEQFKAFAQQQAEQAGTFAKYKNQAAGWESVWELCDSLGMEVAISGRLSGTDAVTEFIVGLKQARDCALSTAAESGLRAEALAGLLGRVLEHGLRHDYGCPGDYLDGPCVCGEHEIRAEITAALARGEAGA